MRETRRKRFWLGGMEFTVEMDKRWAALMARSWPYQHALAPMLQLLERRRHNGASDAGAKAGQVPVFYPRPVRREGLTPDQVALAARIDRMAWYHTVELGGNLRTPGQYDHAPAVPYYHLPESLEGKRCLDVATADGFWAFEMERRGAAEVVALDIADWLDLDLPLYQLDKLRQAPSTGGAGAGFSLAASSLGSRVQRRICNVYDLSPSTFGQFDLVFCGDLMLHITNPLRALQRICTVTRGQAILVEPYEPALDPAAGAGPVANLIGDLDFFTWWQFSRGFLERAIHLAGFKRVELVDEVDVRIRRAPDRPLPRVVFHAFN